MLRSPRLNPRHEQVPQIYRDFQKAMARLRHSVYKETPSEQMMENVFIGLADAHHFWGEALRMGNIGVVNVHDSAELIAIQDAIGEYGIGRLEADDTKPGFLMAHYKPKRGVSKEPDDPLLYGNRARR